MFLIAHKYGRLCNRLFLFARLMAVAKEYNHTLVDLSLRGYAPLFDLSKLSAGKVFVVYKFFGYPIESSRFLEFLIRAALRLLIGLQSTFPFIKRFIEVVTPLGCGWVNLDDPVWEKRLRRKNKIYVFCDWWTLAPNIFTKHRKWVLSRIVPRKESNEEIQVFVKQLRDKQDLLVGLVVRREDYKSYMDGKYYFSMKQYRALADRMVSLCEEKKIRFFICSIDEEDVSVFNGLDFIYRSAHPIENLYTLAECDYLISPPSTYAMWASLVGSTPAFYAESGNIEFSLEDFSPMMN